MEALAEQWSKQCIWKHGQPNRTSYRYTDVSKVLGLEVILTLTENPNDTRMLVEFLGWQIIKTFNRTYYTYTDVSRVFRLADHLNF